MPAGNAASSGRGAQDGARAQAHANSGAPNGARVEGKPPADAVRRRAYEIYMSRAAKGLPGSEGSDWTQAERELAAAR